MTRGAFLDRDGVINAVWVDEAGVSHPPPSVAELTILDGVDEGIARLREAGFRLVVVSNQPDVSRGTQSAAEVHAINRVLDARFNFDAIRVCFHDRADACACRKPQPGMLVDAAAELGIDLRESVMIGDRATDIEAGRRVSCHTVLVAPVGSPSHGADFVAPSLRDAAEWVVSHLTSTDSLTAVS